MQFGAHLDHLPEMLQFIQSQAANAGIIQNERRKLELASEEALVNIISYAYANHPSDTTPLIDIECEKKGSRFEITIKDWGRAFNPIDTELNVDINRPIEERKIGGLGIFLIRQLMDEVSYRREGDENILQMSLRFSAS